MYHEPTVSLVITFFVYFTGWFMGRWSYKRITQPYVFICTHCRAKGTIFRAASDNEDIMRRIALDHLDTHHPQ